MITLSEGRGAGGSIKASAEDFVVEEITKGGVVLATGSRYGAVDLGMEEGGEGSKFCTFVLQKRDWNTVQALAGIARKFRRGIRAMGFAGTKDRTAVSTQLCSMHGVSPDNIMAVHIKDIAINGAWRSNDGVRMGELLGNRFSVVVRGDSLNQEGLGDINAELGGLFPNYFGEQRFGFRNNNVQVGLDIIRGDLEAAVMKILTDTTNERNADAIGARTRLAEEMDFLRATEYFPRYLKYERSMIDHLSKYPTDYGNAIRKLPRSLALMYVHSVDSYIFNREIELRLGGKGGTAPVDGDMVCRTDAYGFPDLGAVFPSAQAGTEGKLFVVGSIVGYDNKVNMVEAGILEELGITQEQFRVKSMPELNCKGAYRAVFAPYLNFSHSMPEEGAMRLVFSLPAGSYATVLMREFVKGDAGPAAGDQPPVDA